MKKLLALLLTLCLVIGMVPLAASAEGEGTETPSGTTANDPFTTVEQYNTAMKGEDAQSTWGGTDVYLTIQGSEQEKKSFDSSEHKFNLYNVQKWANPPKLHLTLEYCTFTGNTSGDTHGNSSFMYLSNCQELTIKNCTFNAETNGLKYGINWNLIGIQGSEVTIENCVFNGNYTKNAIKLNQRNGEDDAATDVKPESGKITAASIKSATIKNCTFSGDNAIISLGSQGKNKGGAASPSTGAFALTMSGNKAGTDGNEEVKVQLDYLAAGNEETVPSVTIPSEGEVTKDADGDLGTEEDFVAMIGDAGYLSLETAIEHAGEGKTIELKKDITLTAPIMLEADDNITIQGNGKSMKFSYSAGCNAVFSGKNPTTNGEGIVSGAKLNVTGVKFVNTNGSSAFSGFAAIVGQDAFNTAVTMSGCTFENLYSGVYVNPVTKEKTEEQEYPKVSITGSTYMNTKYGYSVDDQTNGALSGVIDTEYSDNSGATADSETWDTVAASVTNNGVTKNYQNFTDALTALQKGDTLTLKKNVEVSKSITLPDNVTLDGGKKKITFQGATTNTNDNNSVIYAGNNCTIKDLTIDAGITGENAAMKHGVQFFQKTKGELNNVTISNSTYTAVLVNGSTEIAIRNCNLNTNGYAHIEYAMGSGVTTIPTITVNDNTYKNSSAAQIWADAGTTANVKTAMTGNPTEDKIRQKVMDSITNTGTTDVTVAIAVGSNEPGDIEKETSEGEKKPDPEPTDPPVVYPTTYKTTVEECEGGSVVASPSSAREGQKVTLTVKPQAGQELKSLKVTDKDGDAVTLTKVEGGYTFNMPKGGVTVTALFGCDGGAACPSKGFTDLDSDKWYHEYMDYAVEQGLLEGTSPTTMEPNGTLTRAQLAQVLYNLEGKPQVQGDLDFTDVAEGKWYYAAILWANQEGVVDGMSPDTFAPNEDISRQDLALMLYRYAGEPTVTGDLDGFKDAGQVGDWAKEAITWAVEEGIIDGMTPTTLEPTGTATRAQAAAMLQRFLEG